MISILEVRTSNLVWNTILSDVFQCIHQAFREMLDITLNCVMPSSFHVFPNSLSSPPVLCSLSDPLSIWLSKHIVINHILQNTVQGIMLYINNEFSEIRY